MKKCQELERKALTIVPNFSKDGAPAKKIKHRCSSSRVQLALATTGTSPPPRKKIAKNQNRTGKSPNCNYIKAPKSAADGKILKVFRHDWLGHWRAGVPSTAGGECKLLWLWRTKPFEELFGKGGGGGLALFLGFCNYYVNSPCNFLSFLVFCCPRLVSFAQPTLSFTQFFSILFPTPSWFPN